MCTTTEGGQYLCVRMCVWNSFAYYYTAVPDKPSGVEVIDNRLLIWHKPDRTNGVITGYDVYITFTPSRSPITRNLDRTRFYFIFRQSEIPENVMAHVQVCISDLFCTDFIMTV